MKKIIIIDDDQNMCHVLEKVLTDSGFYVDIAFTGNDALDMTHKQNYDFAIIDYNLPDISGIEVLKKLSPLNPAMGKIMISAYGTKKVIDKAELNNAIFFSKPFDNRDIVKIVKAYTNHQ